MLQPKAATSFPWYIFLTIYTNICSNTLLDITPRKYVEVEFGGIMNTLLIKWSKTLLYSYPHIAKFVRALEEELNSVTSLGYGSKHFSYGQYTYDFLESMLALGKRIRNLKEIEETIDEILVKIGESGEILSKRYVKRRCIEEIIKGVSSRTMYRRFDKAVGEFAFELLKQGYTPDVLEEMFGKERFVIALKNRMKCGSRPIYSRREDTEQEREETCDGGDISDSADGEYAERSSVRYDVSGKLDSESTSGVSDASSYRDKTSAELYILPVEIGVSVIKRSAV